MIAVRYLGPGELTPILRAMKWPTWKYLPHTEDGRVRGFYANHDGKFYVICFGLPEATDVDECLFVEDVPGDEVEKIIRRLAEAIHIGVL